MGAFEEFDVPGAPRGIAADDKGKIWFTAGATIGRLSREGHTDYFGIPPLKDPSGRVTVANSTPSGITQGPDGAIWFTEEEANSIGRLSSSGQFTRYLVPSPPTPATRSDHVNPPVEASERIGPRSITTGPDGALWFTLQRQQNRTHYDGRSHN